MTRLLSIDPGRNTGVALGYYDEQTAYTLEDRWQVHGGLDGFINWWRYDRPLFDELVVERFDLADNEFKADLTPVHIEGALRCMFTGHVAYQPRTDKGRLTGYPPEAKEKHQRERIRNLWLDQFGLFVPGEDNQDSNDAIVHALVYLKQRRHLPTMRHYWPPRSRA